MANKREAKKVIKRTNDIMKAMSELEEFKSRITAIQDALEKEEIHAKETCSEILDIGEKIQKLSTLIRPHTVEGKAKAKYRKQIVKFRKDLEKNRQNQKWLDKYTNKYIPSYEDRWGEYDKRKIYSCRCEANELWLKENDNDNS